MTELTLNNRNDNKIYSTLLGAINKNKILIFKKINIWVLIINFIFLITLLITAIYTKENIYYFLIILPTSIMIILPIILIKIDSKKRVRDIEKFINKNNIIISELISKDIKIENFKIKMSSKMYSKNKDFTNEIINQTIKQLKEH